MQQASTRAATNKPQAENLSRVSVLIPTQRVPHSIGARQNVEFGSTWRMVMTPVRRKIRHEKAGNQSNASHTVLAARSSQPTIQRHLLLLLLLLGNHRQQHHRIICLENVEWEVSGRSDKCQRWVGEAWQCGGAPGGGG